LVAVCRHHPPGVDSPLSLRLGDLWYGDGGVFGEPARHLGGGYGAREEVALDEVAVEVAEESEGVHVLDSFGDDPQAKSLGEADDRGDVAAGSWVGAHDEGSVDFDLSDREPVEAGDRRVAGAEVIDGEVDS
jgi:hypothetical protein